MSYGIEYAFLSEAISMEEIMNAIQRLTQNDLGEYMYNKLSESDKRGCYRSQYGSLTEMDAIMIRQDAKDIVVYFQFEEKSR